MGRAGRKYVLAEYRRDKLAADYLDLLRAVVQGH